MTDGQFTFFAQMAANFQDLFVVACAELALLVILLGFLVGFLVSRR